MTHDPLVVNTQDGSCWRRRAVTREGRGLYGLEGTAKDAPELVLSLLADLAELGLASMADVLPVPVGPELSELEQMQLRVDEVERKYTFDTAELKRQLDSARVDGQRLIRAEQRRAELEAVLTTHRNDDEAEIERLRARVAELEQLPAEYERPVDEDPIAYALTDRADTVEDVTPQVRKLRALLAGQRAQVVEPADQLTRVFAPTQALREDSSAETGGA